MLKTKPNEIEILNHPQEPCGAPETTKGLRRGLWQAWLRSLLLFCGVRQRVERSNPPESFKGLPITLVSAAITAMSFMGFGGLVENIIAALM